MPRTILTSCTDDDGTTLLIYREAEAYYVGTVSAQQCLIPLPAARYRTYAAAQMRFDYERHRQPQPTA